MTERSSQVVAGNSPQTQSRAFYPALDGLRAVAFLMVFLQHYLHMPWGWSGVNVFFVLSGFLITGILVDTRGDAHRARNFYVRRTLRIFPLYYGLVVVALLLEPLLHWHWSMAWVLWPLYLGNFLMFLSPTARVMGSPLELAGHARLLTTVIPKGVYYFGHFWSLCVEEQFYLVWPWIVFRLRNRGLMWICAVCVLAVPLARVLGEHTAPAWMLDSELLYRATPFQLDSLLMGGLAALLWRMVSRERLLAVARVVLLLCVVAMIVYFSYLGTIDGLAWGDGYRYPAWRLTWGMAFCNMLACSVMVSLLRPAGWLARVFAWFPLRWLGRISYGAYVLHDIPHGFYEELVRRGAVQMPGGARALGVAGFVPEYTALLGLVCTLVLAWLSFRWFETPFLNLKERWTVRE